MSISSVSIDINSPESPICPHSPASAPAASSFNSEVADAEMETLIAFFAVEAEQSAPAPDTKSPASQSQVRSIRRILTSTSCVDLPPPCRFVRRKSPSSHAPRVSEAASEFAVAVSIADPAAKYTPIVCHQRKSQSGLCDTKPVDETSAYDQLLMFLM
jgi:hypothetical protein